MHETCFTTAEFWTQFEHTIELARKTTGFVPSATATSPAYADSCSIRLGLQIDGLNEARMNATRSSWTPILAAIAICLFVLGCQSGRPFGRFVRVTQDPDVELGAVEAPMQRLATNRPRSAEQESTGQRQATSPHVQAAKAATAQVANTNLANTKLASDQRTPKPSTAQRNTTSNRENSGSRSAVRNANDIATMGLNRDKSDPISSDKEAELMEAFADYPPEVRKEALRRLKAVTQSSKTENPASPNAIETAVSRDGQPEQSKQPMGFENALLASAENLPELPPKKNERPEIPATRLVENVKETNETTKQNANDDDSRLNLVTVADLEKQQAAAQSKIASAEENVQPAAATSQKISPLTSPASDDGSVVNAVAEVASSNGSVHQSLSDQQQSDSPEAATSPIQTVSATASSDEPSMVQQAQGNADPNKIGTTIASSSDGASSADSMSHTELFSALLTKLSKAPAGESESDRASRLIKLRHLMVLSGDVDRAVEQIDGMSESEQEFLRHQLLGLWTMVDPEGHPVHSRRITTALPQLREATKFAAAATDSLELRSLAFCTEIESYGQIKKFSSNEFDAGQQVILYCEIENFTAEKVEGGFQTHLQGSYDIYNSENAKVISQLLPADQQVSANYLRDYFIAYQMHLPKHLPPGKYRLQMTMEDINGKKYGQAIVPMTMN